MYECINIFFFQITTNQINCNSQYANNNFKNEKKNQIVFLTDNGHLNLNLNIVHL